jgi:hypothetical protein
MLWHKLVSKLGTVATFVTVDIGTVSHVQHGQEIFLFEASSPDMGPSRSPIEWLLVTIRVVERLGFEFCFLSPMCLHDLYRDNFVITFMCRYFCDLYITFRMVHWIMPSTRKPLQPCYLIFHQSLLEDYRSNEVLGLFGCFVYLIFTYSSGSILYHCILFYALYVYV